MNKKFAVSGSILIVISWVEEILARHSAGFADFYYVNVYQKISFVFRTLSGIVHFSLVELLLYLLIIYVVAGFLYSLVKQRFKSYLTSIWCILAVIVFLYVNNCGINYYASGFAKQTGMELCEYNVDDLEAVCQYLADQTEYYANQIEREEDSLLMTEHDWRTVAAETMEAIGRVEKPLEGSYPLPKPVTVSYILSVQKVTGVYSPFTVEANYNNAIPPYNKPFTMCHELSHLRGFMQEKEANFIAFLACISSKDPAFCYSGYLSALIYCTNALYRLEPERCNAIWQDASEGVLADVRYNNAFWRRYDGKTSEIHEKVNDHYLKANGQAEGAAGYDYMVDLIVCWIKEKTPEGGLQGLSLK